MATFEKIKYLLKQNSIAALSNAKWKAFRHKYLWAQVVSHYVRLTVALSEKYSPNKALELYRVGLKDAGLDYMPKPLGSLNIFWVGASKDQDESGYLQALRKIGHVTCFTNWDGGYGLWLKDESGNLVIASESAACLNDDELIKQVSKIHAERPIDFVIGQMWANYLTERSLNCIREQGIPVLNISMDDRLPDNWLKFKGRRMGAVGLVNCVDMVLTTSKETCEWYWAERCPALFWPLASSPEVFHSDPTIERDIDVLFIGNKYGYREVLVQGLSEYGVNVECRGRGWKKGSASAEESAILFQRSKIILGIGTVGHCDDVYTIKLRDFDAPMAGGLYITHRNPDLVELYTEGAEIEYYTSIKECAEKIKHYLNNEEQLKTVANAGRKKAVERDTWDGRLQSTFELLGFLSPTSGSN